MLSFRRALHRHGMEWLKDLLYRVWCIVRRIRQGVRFEFALGTASLGEICAAYVFMETPAEEGDVYDVTEFAKKAMARETPDWVARLCDEMHGLSPTGWRLEVRYKVKDNKYRLIRRPGLVNVSLPTLESLVARALNRPYPIVIYASLNTPSKKINVTRRIQKYLGPRNDFHDAHVRVWDVLPNDDVSALLGKGYFLEIVHSSFQRLQFEFDDNPVFSDTVLHGAQISG